MRNSISLVLLVLAFVSVCSSCNKEGIGGEHESITIGVSTFLRNEIETKTEYSGLDEGNGFVSRTSKYERIDWVNTDRIRILCSKASGHYLDYSIGNVSSSGKYSYADASSVNGDQMEWGSGDHYFFALYPAPGTISNYNESWVVSNGDSSIEALSENSATINGTIPSTQDVVFLPESRQLKPNMNHAYMYATLKTDHASSGSRVNLEFHPLVTTIQFSFIAMDEFVEGLCLNTIKVSSSSTVLSGSFSATLSAEDAYPLEVSSILNGNNTVTVNVPDNVRLSREESTTVSVLMLPLTQTDLTVELYFEGGVTRKLALIVNDGNGGQTPLSISACRKCFINNLAVPSEVWEYVLETTNPDDLTYLGGISASGSVKSYRQKGGTKEPVSWRIEGYYYDESCKDAVEGLDWITEMTQSGTGTISDSEVVEIEYQHAELNVEEGIDIESEVNGAISNSSFGQGSSSSKYFNLANPSDRTSDFVSESANSYIVNGVGYYRIPLVMGNGLINGEINPKTNSYTGRTSDYGTLFYDYKEQPISSPLLHKSNSVSGFTPGVPSSAFVVWEDENGLIEVVDEGYSLPSGCITYSSGNDLYWLNFHVSQPKQGNAVIAVADENGEVMWSWHIWVTNYQPFNVLPYDFEAQDIQLFTHQASSSNMLMPVNLGWIYIGDASKNIYRERTVYALVRQEIGSEEAVMKIAQPGAEAMISEGRNPYYQWGRKDALWPSDGTLSNVSAQCYGRFPAITNNTNQSSLGSVIRTPGVFYGTTGNWTTAGKALNLWSADNTDVLYNDAPVYKTIYDPSPAGYCLPPSGVFSGFTVSGNNVMNNSSRYNVVGSYDRGWVFVTGSNDTPFAFFPATGRRKYTPGTVEYVQKQGFYWTAIPNKDYTYSGDRGSYLLFYGTAICPNYSGNRSSGFSVRPARQVVF